MSPNAFSPFEVLLLKSHDQRCPATLLLLAWVFVNKRTTLDEDRRYLESLATDANLRQALPTLIASASHGVLDDIQLAAEVLLGGGKAPATSLLHQAVALATSDGTLSSRNHHILRFLADLVGASPAALSSLFRDITGRSLGAPDDPSRRMHWETAGLDDEPDTAGFDSTHESRRAPWGARARQAAERRWRERRDRREQARAAATRRIEEAERLRKETAERQAREAAERIRAQQQHAEREARRQRAREEARHQEERRREEADREEKARGRQHEGRREPFQASQSSYRLRLALIELELGTEASRADIKKAYRRLAQRHHPDRFHGQSEWRLRLASQRFQRIRDAYDLLMQHA
ncbi:J domain-containing protein [Salinicola rhizosphaerae]|uniref:J domain-containing protein n=1 Tax=Salinicola rhizosphaerae TaxID=1443141 RepID=A0ABQ3DXM3_9GAMM|nr:J domain-containing protein [Salinicola rhizosphaerae]GHB15821.1 hypothetical protein GCM10009038_12650 [Salinicola rhizosphaerae]